MGKLGVVVPAAGQGQRMGTSINKQFLQLNGLPVIVHTLKFLQISELVSEIVLVGAQQDLSHLEELVYNYTISKVSHVICGGAVRQESVREGVIALGQDVDRVVVHDGARPLLTSEQFDEFIKSAGQAAAAIMAVPLKDTVKRVDSDGLVLETPSRSELVAVQTPQLFDRFLLEKAHGEAAAQGYIGTDDASLVEWMGCPVQVCSGHYENLKITTPDDLWLAEAILLHRSSGFQGS